MTNSVKQSPVKLPSHCQINDPVSIILPGENGENPTKISECTVDAIRFYESGPGYDVLIDAISNSPAILKDVWGRDIEGHPKTSSQDIFDLPTEWNGVPVYIIGEKVSFLGNDCTVACVIFTEETHYYDLQLPGGCIVEYVDEALCSK